MGFFRNRTEIGGEKYTETQIAEKALAASEAIILNGFNSAEELYKLLKINCLDSAPVINKCLSRLATEYNASIDHEATGIFHQNYPKNDKTSRDSHIANLVLMNNKLKIIADVRSFIATQQASNLQELPIFESSVNYISGEPSNLKIEDREENVIIYKNNG